MFPLELRPGGLEGVAREGMLEKNIKNNFTTHRYIDKPVGTLMITPTLQLGQTIPTVLKVFRMLSEVHCGHFKGSFL
jgi:hypothetical protein